MAGPATNISWKVWTRSGAVYHRCRAGLGGNCSISSHCSTPGSACRSLSTNRRPTSTCMYYFQCFKNKGKYCIDMSYCVCRGEGSLWAGLRVGHCVCGSGYRAAGGGCEGVAAGPGESCSSTRECGGAGAWCRAGVCRCPAHRHPAAGQHRPVSEVAIKAYKTLETHPASQNNVCTREMCGQQGFPPESGELQNVC